jgi:hypothetical protein
MHFNRQVLLLEWVILHRLLGEFTMTEVLIDFDEFGGKMVYVWVHSFKTESNK